MRLSVPADDVRRQDLDDGVAGAQRGPALSDPGEPTGGDQTVEAEVDVEAGALEVGGVVQLLYKQLGAAGFRASPGSRR
jgi:hypothetical protein